jgi:hypothetical protein
MDPVKEEEVWDHILALAKQAVYDNDPHALKCVLEARQSALWLYNSHVQMRGRLLVDLAVLIQLEAQAMGNAKQNNVVLQ